MMVGTIWYSAPHTAGLRGLAMSRGALCTLCFRVLPPSFAAALRSEGILP